MANATPILLDLVARVSLLFGAAALVCWCLRRSSAATRHLVWTVAIAGSLALPVATLIGPRVELGVLPAAPATRSSPAVTARALPVERPAPPNPSESRQRSESNRDAAFLSSSAPSRSALVRWPSASDVPSALTLVLAVWCAGFVAVLLRLALGSARMWWIARRARPLSSGSWLRLAERLAGVLGVRDRVVFLEGARAAMPMTFGIVRPRVLLPEAASEWPVARQRVVLLHELAHVKRRDCMTQLLAQAACAIYWFNPLAWLAARRLRAEREHACDDLVLAAGTRGSDYADHLLEIARSMRSVALPTWAAVAMAHRSQLEGRLMAILDPQVPRRFPTRRTSVLLVTTIALLALPIAVVTPVPRAAEAVTIIESGIGEPAGAAQPSPAPRPTPMPAPSPSPTPVAAPAAREAVKQVLSDGTVSRASARAIATALEGSPAAEWLGEVVGGAIEGAAEGIGEGVSDGIRGGVAGGVQGGVTRSPEAEGKRDPRAVAALMEALKDSDKEVREQAMHALSNMRAPEALGAIRGALKDETPSVREQAAFALGQYRDRESVDTLVAALKDPAANVREQVVFALGQIRDPRAADGLMAALKDTDEDVREQAAFALGQLRHAGAVDALAAALKDANASVREQSVFALGQIRDRRAVDPLIAALRDQNPSVREQAAFALGEIGDARAVDALMAALKDANVEVRRHAAFALGQLR
jgi:beta-lactamase regulating signal transducer with metallopeptidase domain